MATAPVPECEETTKLIWLSELAEASAKIAMSKPKKAKRGTVLMTYFRFAKYPGLTLYTQFQPEVGPGLCLAPYGISSPIDEGSTNRNIALSLTEEQYQYVKTIEENVIKKGQEKINDPGWFPSSMFAACKTDEEKRAILREKWKSRLTVKDGYEPTLQVSLDINPESSRYVKIKMMENGQVRDGTPDEIEKFSRHAVITEFFGGFIKGSEGWGLSVRLFKTFVHPKIPLQKGTPADIAFLPAPPSSHPPFSALADPSAVSNPGPFVPTPEDLAAAAELAHQMEDEEDEAKGAAIPSKPPVVAAGSSQVPTLSTPPPQAAPSRKRRAGPDSTAVDEPKRVKPSPQEKLQ